MASLDIKLCFSYKMESGIFWVFTPPEKRWGRGGVPCHEFRPERRPRGSGSRRACCTSFARRGGCPTSASGELAGGARSWSRKPTSPLSSRRHGLRRCRLAAPPSRPCDTLPGGSLPGGLPHVGHLLGQVAVGL